MKDITCFSANTLAQFDNKYENIVTFNSLMMDAGNNVYDKYSKEDTQTIIRNQFDKILGLNFREANSTFIMWSAVRRYFFLFLYSASSRSNSSSSPERCRRCLRRSRRSARALASFFFE